VESACIKLVIFILCSYDLGNIFIEIVTQMLVSITGAQGTKTSESELIAVAERVLAVVAS